jgi:hypothetical protein
VRFEVADCDLCGVASMAPGWYQFQLHVVLVTNEVLHGLGNFIIQDMFLGRDVGSFEAAEEGLIGAYHFLILATLHWMY